MLRTLTTLAAAALVAVAAPAVAQSPFDGTWKADLTSASVEAKPNETEIKNGVFSCASCLPTPYSVKADGAFHAVKGRPYWDEIAVTVVDERTVGFQYRKDGKVVGRSATALSSDGNTLSIKSSNTNNGAGAPIETTATSTRVGPAAAGAHATSGQWKSVPATSASDAALTFTLKVEGDTLHMRSPGMGESLDATFGGPFVVNAGDPGKTMTKAERLAPNVIRLTDMQLGKVTGVSTYTVSADGQTITSDWTDPRNGAKGSTVARKQP